MNYEIIQTLGFKNDARRAMLSAEDVRLIELEIMKAPGRHPMIAGTRGLRKMRFAPKNRSSGKSGGIRVRYFIIESAAHIYLALLFAKNEKDNLSRQDKKVAADLIMRTRKLYLK